MNRPDRICNHDKLGHDVEVTISGIGTVKLCDDCRRLLCTCERCSAVYTGQDGKLYCNAGPRMGADDETMVAPFGWCRDGWRQARPWTREEVDGWLGNEPETEAP